MVSVPIGKSSGQTIDLTEEQERKAQELAAQDIEKGGGGLNISEYSKTDKAVSQRAAFLSSQGLAQQTINRLRQKQIPIGAGQRIIQKQVELEPATQRQEALYQAQQQQVQQQVQQPITIKQSGRDIPMADKSSITSQTISSFRKDFSWRNPFAAVGSAAKTFGGAAKRKFQYLTEPAKESTEQAEILFSKKIKGTFPAGKKGLLIEEEIESYNRESEQLALDINRFNQSPQKTQSEYERLVSRQGELKSKAEEIKTKGEDLKVNVVENLERGVLEAGVGAFLLFPKLASSPVKTTKETAEGLINLPKSFKENPARTIGNIVGSYFAFRLVSAASTGKVPKASEVKLRTAVERAEIKTKVTGGITTEIQINKLQVPENIKVELRNQLRAGKSIRSVSAEVEGVGEADAALIKKELPKQDIRFIEVTNQQGQIINRVAVGKVEIGGKVKYREDILSGGTGQVNLETGRGYIESVTETRMGTKLTSASKQLDVFKSQAKEFKTPDEIIRVTTSRAKTFEGGKVTAEKGKPISYKDLQEVAQSEINRAYPVSESKSVEIQRLKRIEVATSGEDILGIKKVYASKGGTGKTKKLTPPSVEFDRIPSTKSMKSFEPEKIQKQDITKIKELKKPEKSPAQIKIEKETQQVRKIIDAPSIDLTNQIKSSVKRGVKENLKTTSSNKLGLKVSPILASKQRQKVKQTPVPTLNYENISKLSERQLQNVYQVPKLSQLQKQQQIPRLTQIQTPIYSTPIIPEVNIPKFPPFIPFSKRTESKILNRKLIKKSLKPESKYAASLAAAALQAKPLQITKKQYEKLGKRTYSGAETRPVVEIVPEKELKKEIKKVEF